MTRASLEATATASQRLRVRGFTRQGSSRRSSGGRAGADLDGSVISASSQGISVGGGSFDDGDTGDSNSSEDSDDSSDEGKDVDVEEDADPSDAVFEAARDSLGLVLGTGSSGSGAIGRSKTANWMIKSPTGGVYANAEGQTGKAGSSGGGSGIGGSNSGLPWETMRRGLLTHAARFSHQSNDFDNAAR